MLLFPAYIYSTKFRLHAVRLWLDRPFLCHFLIEYLEARLRRLRFSTFCCRVHAKCTIQWPCSYGYCKVSLRSAFSIFFFFLLKWITGLVARLPESRASTRLQLEILDIKVANGSSQFDVSDGKLRFKIRMLVLEVWCDLSAYSRKTVKRIVYATINRRQIFRWRNQATVINIHFFSYTKTSDC